MRDVRARAACDVAEALGAVVDLLRTHPVEMLHRRAAWICVRPATSPPHAENGGIAVCLSDLRVAAGEQNRLGARLIDGEVDAPDERAGAEIGYRLHVRPPRQRAAKGQEHP